MPRQQQKPLERWGGGGWHACMHEVHSVHSTDGIFNDSVTVQYMGVPLHLTILFSYCLCTQKVVPAFSVKNEWKKKEWMLLTPNPQATVAAATVGKDMNTKVLESFVVYYATWVPASLVAQRLKHLPGMRSPRFNPSVGKIPWRRKWQPTPVPLPGESHGGRSLVGYSPWGHKVHQGCALRKIQFRDKRILALDSKDA